MRRLLSGVLTAALLAVGCTRDEAPPPYDSLYQAPIGSVGPFTFTDQNGRTVTRDDLLGKVWVANFFFSRCAGDCSKTNAGMAALQQRLAGYSDVRLVGFSVDPEEDTPEVLRNYAANWNADPERWLFLTGEEAAMHALIQDSFKQAVSRSDDPRPGNKIIHTFALMVVDHKGQIRGYVDGRDAEQVARVPGRVRQLVLAMYLPSVNALLNGTCAALLLLGYVAIKRRWILFHKIVMLSALAVSAAFLASYLYYHFVVLEGKPTGFTGVGWVRPLYFGILLSHTVLAAAVAPLALLTTYLGLRNRLAGHVRMARWTLPLWLYVSVTGVVVYGMLYHLYPSP